MSKEDGTYNDIDVFTAELADTIANIVMDCLLTARKDGETVRLITDGNEKWAWEIIQEETIVRLILENDMLDKSKVEEAVERDRSEYGGQRYGKWIEAFEREGFKKGE